MNEKIPGIVFTISGIYYLVAEFICAVSFNDSLVNTYLFHTISELGIPNANSPLFYLINLAFILMGLSLIFGNYTTLKNYVLKYKSSFYPFTLITALGVIIVGLIHGGNPLTSGYHTLGAVMAILGGNILLIIISRSLDEFSKYEKITMILGIIGLIAFWTMFFNMTSIYMPVFERLSVYPLIIWSLLTGTQLIKN